MLSPLSPFIQKKWVGGEKILLDKSVIDKLDELKRMQIELSINIKRIDNNIHILDTKQTLLKIAVKNMAKAYLQADVVEERLKEDGMYV